MDFDNPLASCVKILVVCSSTFAQSTHLHTSQQYIIPLLLPSAKRTMNKEILNKKIIRPVSARKGPLAWIFRPGPARPVSAHLGPRAGPRFTISNSNRLLNVKFAFS